MMETDINKSMDEKGYVLLYSELFKDYVAFYLTSKAGIPPKYVTYSDEELRRMFGAEKVKLLSERELVYINNAKKVFGTVIVEASIERDNNLVL